MPRKVLGVGNCSFDHANLSGMISSHFAAEVVPAATADAALEMLRGDRFDLVLVNRVFNGGTGIDLIRRIKADDRLAETPVIMLSNYPESQADAETAGAAPGFGKAQLADPQTLGKLRPFLG